MKTENDMPRMVAQDQSSPTVLPTAVIPNPSPPVQAVKPTQVGLSEIPQRIIDKLSEQLFLPAQQDYSGSLRKPWFIVSFLLLMLVGAGSLPFMQSFILNTYPNFHIWLRLNASLGKVALESASIFLEIFIAIFIGGSIMSERLALTQPVRDLIEKVQGGMDAGLKNQAQNLEEYFKSLPDKAKKSLLEILVSLEALRTGVTYLNFFGRTFSLLSLATDFFIVIRSELPRYARNLVAVKLITSFPGGLYGLVTYFLFFWLIVIKVFKLYFDAA